MNDDPSPPLGEFDIWSYGSRTLKRILSDADIMMGIKNMFRGFVLAGCLVIVSYPSIVSGSDISSNTDARAILAQQQQLRAEAIAKKGRFKDLDAKKLNEMYAHQDKVGRLLEGQQRTTDLRERDQIAVLNALESIEAIVNSAEDERLICERHRPVGSNRPQTTCKTVAERRAEREAAQNDIGRRNLACSEAAMGPGGCQR